MDTTVMMPFELRLQDFPVNLYRVQYPGSQTRYSLQRGFRAASNFTPYTINGFRNAIAYHIDWRCRVRSPFISLFRGRQHARNWAQRWADNQNGGSCEIVQVWINADDDVMVFRLAYLLDRLGISTSLDRSQYQSEYLCFRHINPGLIYGVEQMTYPARDYGSDDDSDDYY
ncbi:hypothetical protein FRC14_004999 [Serendipita sp. 396]|nr:hypothetical protein FRC14_004999 [Serendipita sp. 396]